MVISLLGRRKGEALNINDDSLNYVPFETDPFHNSMIDLARFTATVHQVHTRRN